MINMGIRLENISKFYTSATNVTMALQKINLEFGNKGFVAITGESGSGKSTLIKVLSGMLSFEEGELYIDERPMSVCEESDWEEYRRGKIGFVFQEYNLIDEYTVLDNVESAIIIRGIRKDNIIDYAKKMIEKVGLAGLENQRASKLSSGQKQRLAIARALAKEADIIIADEPTGNLDSENGQKIMELFGEIAKDKLVIMVTHNYPQAEPYVDRQIRLFDGKVVSDTGMTITEQSGSDAKGGNQETKKNKWSGVFLAWKYTLKNIVRQPMRLSFIALFVVITAVVSFFFLGQIVSHYDDTYTKDYDDDVFAYENDRRIVVKKSDDSVMTKEDCSFFATIDKVLEVETYDLCNDIRYYGIPGEDYYITYYEQSYWHMDEPVTVRSVSFSDEAEPKFMRSASCIRESDLKEGRLPKKRNEIVVYSDLTMEELDSFKVFFQNEDVWSSVFYEYDFEVVGVLKEKTTQIYYSEAFCDMLTASYKQGGVILEGAWCTIDEQYKYRGILYPMIGENLTGQEMQLSAAYYPAYTRCAGLAHMHCISFDNEHSAANIYVDKLTVEGETEKLQYKDMYIGESNEELQAAFINISEDFFYELCDYGSHQASLYIEHYAYTDEVLEALKEAGYDGVSSYRISSVEYNTDKVENRIILLLTSFAILIVIALLEMFIVSSFLKLKRKFYSVFGFLGMETGVLKKMNYFEVNLYTVVAVLLTVIFGLMGGLKELTVYFKPVHYMIYFLYNFALAQITVIRFNRYLDKKVFRNKK